MQQPTLSDEARAAMLARQQKSWPKCVKAGSEGNPYATLCRHCYRRHQPPVDEICPRDPPPAQPR